MENEFLSYKNSTAKLTTEAEVERLSSRNKELILLL